MMAGKCPCCGNFVTVLNGHALTINVGMKSFNGVSYQCPNPVCNAVLGCQIDPIALKTDTVTEVKRVVETEVRNIG